ncbi:hypothetical protein BDW69DRAFT_186679 [Aspergillus filifer]
MSIAKTPITELVLPVFKDDAETISTIQTVGHEIFSLLVGIPGIQFIAHGFVIYDEGKKVESTHRGVLLLEWDDLSSFHGIYPNSPKFVEFIESAKPLLSEPSAPKLHASVTSPVGAGSAGVTQIVKVKEGHDTEEVWERLSEYLGGKEQALSLSHSKGVEGEEGIFLGLIGWGSVDAYMESKSDETLVNLLEQLGGNGKELDVVAQLQTITV